MDGCNYLDPVMVENKWKHFKLELGDVILCTSASIGKASIVGPEAVGAIPPSYPSFNFLITFIIGS